MVFSLIEPKIMEHREESINFAQNFKSLNKRDYA